MGLALPITYTMLVSKAEMSPQLPWVVEEQIHRSCIRARMRLPGGLSHEVALRFLPQTGFYSKAC